MAKKQKQTGWLIVALVAVVGGGVLFMGAVSGWFSQSFKLDAEYYCSEECEEQMVELSAEGYTELVENKKSFVVFVDQGGCTTADRVRQYMTDYTKEAGIKVYRMMFEQAKETTMHDYVKYYPSVVMVSKGKVLAFLRADEDEDAEMYNNYDVFKEWMQKYMK